MILRKKLKFKVSKEYILNFARGLIYIEKVPEKDSGSRIWVKDIYENVVTYLKCVCNTFSNYTLHDETHV